MDIINYNDLGQWSLQKADHRIPASQEHADWVWEANGKESSQKAKKAKMDIPKMDGAHRKSSLNVLSQQTQTRLNPESGEMEYLLHRGGKTGGVRDHAPTERTSWTPVIKAAHRQAYYEDTPGKVGSAWIPESQLHTGLAHYTYGNPQTQKTADAEQEWLVNHDKPITMDKVVPAQNPRKLQS